MFRISLFVVGGGFAIIAVAEEVFSKKLKWTEEGELIGSLPLFQMVPGIIAGNTAVYLGRKVAGIPGAAVALAGVFLPSVIVFSAVSAGYDLIPLGNAYLDAAFLGLRASLTGVIFAMIVRGWRKSVVGFYGYAAAALAVFAIAVAGINPALVILVALAAGVAIKFSEGTWAGRRVFRSFWAVPLVFVKYGLIAFGGGYVLVPVYLTDFVGKAAPYLQLGEREFADVMALTQMTPGPISINCATFFGYRFGLADFPGLPAMGIVYAIVATVAILLPGSILLYLALGSMERFKESRFVQGILFGVKPVTVAMMANALFAFAMMSVWTRGDSGATAFHPLAAILAVAVAVLMLLRKVGVVKLIFASAVVSVLSEIAAYLWRAM